jgi:transcriptional regulator with XRE-family HTH domain
MAVNRRWAVEDFAERLRQRRAELGLTQEALASRMEGVTLRAYSRWESGEAIPQDRNMSKIAAALELDMSDLVVELVPKQSQGSPAQMDRIEAKVDLIISLLAKR